MKPTCYATLVAFYGEKPTGLVACIEALQLAAARACPGFEPYDVAQVHATVVGLEGLREEGALLNTNFRALRGESRSMQLIEALRAVRASARWPMGLQMGGFEPDAESPFVSRGQHPYRRSLSLQGERVVMIAWPHAGGVYSESLAQLRHELAAYGLLHKYHPQPTAADNDLFFVLGNVPASTPLEQRATLEQQGRELLRQLRVALTLSASDLSVVQYEDPGLPLASSVARGLWPLTAVEIEALVRFGW